MGIKLERKNKRNKISRDGKGGAIIRINEDACCALEEKLLELGDGWKISELASLLIVEGIKESYIPKDTE